MNYLYMTVDLSAECPYKRKSGVSVPYRIGDMFLCYPVVGYIGGLSSANPTSAIWLYPL